MTRFGKISTILAQFTLYNWQFLRVYLVLRKNNNPLWLACYAIGQFFIAVKGQEYWTHNLAIWSHWLLITKAYFWISLNLASSVWSASTYLVHSFIHEETKAIFGCDDNAHSYFCLSLSVSLSLCLSISLSLYLLSSFSLSLNLSFFLYLSLSICLKLSLLLSSWFL